MTTATQSTQSTQSAHPSRSGRPAHPGHPVRPAPAVPSLQRPVPAWGGFSARLFALELRRLLRNRRTVSLMVVMPVALYFIASTSVGGDQDAGHGNVAAYILISMGVYGAMLATTSAGAMVAVERSRGWTRQLRLTPLTPVAYILLKACCAVVLGGLSVTAVYLAGAISGGPQMSGYLWPATAAIALAGSLVFAALGLFLGYLLPSENVMQFLGLGVAAMAFLGGLFYPIPAGSTLDLVASFTPLYGLGHLVHAPLTGDPVQVTWVVSVLAWFAIFALGAVWRFRADTARG